MKSAQLHTDGSKIIRNIGGSGLPTDHRINTTTAHNQLLNQRG